MKSIKDGGGPAFPTETADAYYHGLSVRDWFAGMAMQGMLAANAKFDEEVTDKNVDYIVAREAYASADAMLAQRELPQTPP